MMGAMIGVVIRADESFCADVDANRADPCSMSIRIAIDWRGAALDFRD